jgi:hypothetical protein
MAITVIQAFNEFLVDTVNLRKEETATAKTSRDWLLEQISNFPDKVEGFPNFYNGKSVFFGSFSRETKKRPLDDIDIMICLNGEGSTYDEGYGNITIKVSDVADRLRLLCNDGENSLNSIKVVNKFVSALTTISQYKNAEKKRNQEAAVLMLSSYDWNFDIVPCFLTTENIYGRAYYLIPDGSGGWKKTDPLIDHERITRINQAHDGNLLNLIRIMKYWNKRPTMPSMGSYLLEVMILNYYENMSDKVGEFVDLEIPRLLEYFWLNITNDVQDPKGIQGNINFLSQDDRTKISTRAWSDRNKSLDARKFETDDNHYESIRKWAEIFGGEFPSFG